MDIVKYDLTDAAIAKLEKKYELLTEITDPHSYKAVAQAIADFRTRRGQVAAQHKMLKKGALEYGRACDAEKNRIIDRLLVGEARLKDLKKKEDDRKQAIRDEKANAEAARVASIRAKISEIRELTDRLSFRDTEELPGLLALAEGIEITEDIFQEFDEEAIAARQNTIDFIEAAIANRERREKETAERQAEAERQKIEAARLAKIKAEQDAEAERLASEKREIEAAQAARDAELAAREKAIQDEKDEIERAEFERKAREEATAKAEKDAAEKVEREAREATERAAKEKAEAERLAALRPDAEKLFGVAHMLKEIPFPTCSDSSAIGIIQKARDEILNMATWIEQAAHGLTETDDDKF